MRHRFTSGKGQVLEARDGSDGHGGLRLYHVTREERGPRGRKEVVDVQRRLDDQPLRPAVVAALLQEILRLAKESNANG